MTAGGRGRALLLGLVLFLGAIGLAALRVGLLDRAGDVRLSADWALTDFYSAAYAAARAVLAGSTPYASDGTYPPYAPLHLLLHLPFALLSEPTAGVLYFLVTALLAIPLAMLSLRLGGAEPAPHRVLLLAAAVLASRPGHWTLLLGQVSILLTLATYLALAIPPTRPWAGGAALAVALLKATFGLPLALLLWAWGRGRTALAGLALAALVNLPLLVVYVAREGGPRELFEAAVGGYRSWQDIVDVNPATSNTRTDITSLVSRFVGAPVPDWAQILLAATVLGVAALALWQLRGRDSARSSAVGMAIICLAMSLVGFHRGYDLVLLTAPCVALALGVLAPPQAPPTAARLVLLGCFAVLALNWVATESVLEALQPGRALWLAITSANGLCLLALFAAYLWLASRRGRGDPDPRAA